MDQHPRRLEECLSFGGSSASRYAGLVPSFVRHIVFGIDNTVASQEALKWAVEHVYRTGDMVHLVHVIPEPDTLHFHPGLFTPPDDAEETSEFREAEQMVRAAFAPILRQKQIPGDVHIVVAPDDPDSIAGVLLAKAVELQEIAAAANANNEATTSSSFSFDQPAGGAGAPPLPPGAGDGSGLGDDSRVVLVVAGHSKQRLQEFWTGSVCKRLLRKSTVPLIVHRSLLS